MQDLNPAVDRLRDAMHDIGRAALGRMRVGDSLEIRQERDRLVQWLGGEVAPDEAGQDRIVAALETFRGNRHLSGIRQARFACYGCTQALDSGYRLIEDRSLFEALLGYVARHRYRTRLFRKCYRGLLGAYFSYDAASADATADGRGNHEALRQFLEAYQGFLESAEFTPPWVAVLAAHPRLLATDPCQAYGLAALRGNWAVLDEIHEGLGVSGDSWLMRQLVLAQVDAATALDDEPFVRHLDSILLLLCNHPLHAATALLRLLERQARCAGAEVSPALGEQAVALLGNPWLANNVQNWQCSAAARDMVARWLKRHLLHDFFATFADVDVANTRRAEFWDIYCDDLSGMYFALGKAAFTHRDSACFKFRRDAKGLVVRLAEAAPDLHVLILQFEQHHVVELNKAQQVAYFYATRHGTPPFYLSKSWIDIGALSVSKLVEGKTLTPLSQPMRHQDGVQLAWEGKFARELGITPHALRNLCRRYRCRGEPPHSGPVPGWIRPEQGRPLENAAGAILAGWGYTWSSQERAYSRATGGRRPAHH